MADGLGRARGAPDGDRVREAQRTASDALYRAYFENTAEALFVIAVSPHGRFSIEELNPAHEAASGLRSADLAGRTLEEQLPAEVAAAVTANYRRAVEEGRAISYREVIDLPGGVRHWDTVLVPVRDEAGRVSRIVGSSRDVTGQVLAEEQLRQAQKMEAVGQLTGGIAHDFNNLLTGVIGALDMMQRSLADGSTEKLQRYATIAITSANRAAALIHRLLAFARRQPLDPSPVCANHLVAGMEELLRRTLGEAIELEIVAADGLWQTLCDPSQLESAILNLAINARDAMPRGGKLTIETGTAELDEAKVRDIKEGHYVCINVSDTGTGMTPDVIAKAFEPFFTTKPIGQGTGLGLSMIYGFARQSGGSAAIYSEVGQGSTVKLYLPRHISTGGDRIENLPDPVVGGLPSGDGKAGRV